MDGATKPGTDSPTLRARLFVAMQHLLPQHFLSRQVHRLARCRVKPVKNALIGSFVRHFRPDMSEAADPEPHDYPSFNAFFTRSLRPGSRPSDPDRRALVSPVDGTVSQIGRLDGLRMLQAKGHDYSLEALLGGASRWVQRFAGGSFATLYLAPFNYHRIHMPAAAARCAPHGSFPASSSASTRPPRPPSRASSRATSGSSARSRMRASHLRWCSSARCSSAASRPYGTAR